MVWTGQSSRYDGETRVNTNYDNTVLQITYDLQGGSAAELAYLQREIHRFFMECRQYEENAELNRVWLEYRWSDSLSGLPAPVFGQFSYYYRVLSGAVPRWPRDLHTGALTANQILGVVAELTCKPFAEGLRQKVGTGKGQLELFDEGVLLVGSINAATITNEFTNPEFSHATWNNSWSAENADLEADQEVRPGYVYRSGSAARLTNTNASTDYYYCQSINAITDSVGYVCSCYARRPDGGAITSSDLAIMINSSAQTTSFINAGDGWYLCYATADSPVGAANYGIDVKAGRSIIVDAFQLIKSSTSTYGSNDKPDPYFSGNSIGCAWSGTAHNSTSTNQGDGGCLGWTMANELVGEFTISFWITTKWANTWLSGNVTIFNYYVDADNEIEIEFDQSNNYFIFNKEVDGANTSDTGTTRTISYDDNIHVCLVQDTTNTTLYINGSQDAQISKAMADEPDGTMTFGSRFNDDNPANVLIDGCRIWDTALSTTEITALYNNEKEVKDAGGSIGMPPYLWTKDGDDVLDNVDGLVSATSKDNWGVVGGVVGDVEAQTEWRIQPPTEAPSVGYWLGRKAVDSPIDGSIFWVELDGTADVGSSSNDAYETIAAGTSDQWFKNAATIDQIFLKAVPGRYQWVARMKVSTNSIEVFPIYTWGAASIDHMVAGDALSVGTNANFLLRDCGDMVVRCPAETLLHTGELDYADFRLRVDRTASATVYGDFIQILPYPCCYVESINATLTISAGEPLIIESEPKIAYTLNAGNINEIFEYQGEPVTLVPNAYNYVYLLQGAKDATYDVTDTATITLYITPRWLLPGGTIA